MEHDSMGDVLVPSAAMYGAQTQRAVDNFRISGFGMPPHFIHGLAMIKRAAADVNCELGLLDRHIAQAIGDAAREVEQGRHDKQFPVDVFQTGSGTSSNMNVNEVIAHLASERAGCSVHPNDHVNMGQSSNDVIPTAIHLSACIALQNRLLPALAHLQAVIEHRADDCRGVVKTGRTHLMDALPLRLDQELGAWASQVADGTARIQASMGRLQRLAIGGTAIGTGLNAHPECGRRVAAGLAVATRLPFVSSDDHFRDLSSQDAAVEMSGQLNTLAAGLMKISNDLRWMNSGPLAGLGEIQLPALQPGSSIMPGKVNPVIPEAVAMVCAQVTGYHMALTIAGQSGSFQLNVMLPLIAHNLLQSIEILANAVRLLADKAISGFTVSLDRLGEALERNPILVTALNAVIGYEKGAEIAKKAYAEGRPVIEVARELTDLCDDELQRLLDPAGLTEGGIRR
ncbi:MAG: class II fumarate hydratase [Sedimenticolaceae bacterium]